MSEVVEFELLPPKAEAARAKTEKYRRIALVVGWICAVVFFISFVFSDDIGDGTILALVLSLAPGFVHWHLHFKHWLRRGPIGWIVWFLAAYTLGFFTSWYFAIRDLVRVIKKKLLVDESENKFFLMRADVQAEMAAEMEAYQREQDREALAESIARHANNPAENMKKLKEMLDQGLITQAEYDRKKTELLDKM